MQQYYELKAQQPEAILLYRVGDFYETFGEDAVLTAAALGITLTSRNNGGSDIELAGFPHHSLDLYLPRLVRSGYRVAICEQLEKPSKEKKIVRRGVTEVVTPGLATTEQLLEHHSNNYLAALHFAVRNRYGIALLDLSTGEFLVSEGDKAYIDKLLQSLQPSEILLAKSRRHDFEQQYGHKQYSFAIDDWVFMPDFTRERLLEHFGVNSLKGFGVEELEQAQIAAGAILHYLSTTENKNLQHINTIARLMPERYVWLDRFTIRNLELLHSPHEGGITLAAVLDHTVSPMGARLMKKWIVLPLKKASDIQARLDVVGFLKKETETAELLLKQIRKVGDLERLISRVPLGKITPRELRQLERSLDCLHDIKDALRDCGQARLEQMADKLNPCNKLTQLLCEQLVEEPPVNLNKGGVIADGCHDELDDWRHIINNSKQLLVDIQQREAEGTGISNLKIGFNNVFGYYLEVTNKYKNQGIVPADWIRKQTLTNSERYITPELKELEAKILQAEEKILQLEAQLFEQLIFATSDYIQPIQHNAQLLAQIDCLLSFATVAQKNRYVKPAIDDSLQIDIKAGRHPVIEQYMPPGEEYVPNDVFLDNDSQQILMITGPNMSGKSAILRQTALICLMAQMGSFVPAERARIGLLDKVFTRVGASDNISSGESTFMVEMNETAGIMNNISARSLLLLDEIGRGTSTYDGISIAWSIVEYLHNNSGAQPKTLFATHYHELNELATDNARIKNFHVATKEIGQKVVFLRKLTPGGSHHSFGIHVARMSGMPAAIVQRAQAILGQLEQKSIAHEKDGQESPRQRLQKMPAQTAMQLSIFETADPVWQELQQALSEMDISAMTPIECMMKLNAWQQMLKEKH